MQLLADFEQLEPASSPNSFNAVQLTDGRQDYLGKDQQGAPSSWSQMKATRYIAPSFSIDT